MVFWKTDSGCKHVKQVDGSQNGSHSEWSLWSCTQKDVQLILPADSWRGECKDYEWKGDQGYKDCLKHLWNSYYLPDFFPPLNHKIDRLIRHFVCMQTDTKQKQTAAVPLKKLTKLTERK